MTTMMTITTQDVMTMMKRDNNNIPDTWLIFYYIELLYFTNYYTHTHTHTHTHTQN